VRAVPDPETSKHPDYQLVVQMGNLILSENTISGGNAKGLDQAGKPGRFQLPRHTTDYILVLMIITMGYQFLCVPADFTADIDAIITEGILFTIAVVVLLIIRRYDNFQLELGLALIIYAMGIHFAEEFTREFGPLETLLLAIILLMGFVFTCIGVFCSRRKMDEYIVQLKQQEADLRVRSAELADMSAALEQANRKLRLLTRITRHDIRNRLFVASGYLELLVEQECNGEKRQYIDKISRSLDSIQQIIGFTEMYEEIGNSRPEWQEIRPLIDTAAHQLGRERVTIENAAGSNIEVYADSMIGRVFFNLIDNALDYGGQKLTRIRFASVQRENGDLLITCENDGEGIPTPEKERIFERGVGKKTGLGLYLAREILSITDITIAETGNPDAGVRFEIRVPEGKYRSGSGNTVK